EAAAAQLLATACWDHALGVLARYSAPAAFAGTLGRALRESDGALSEERLSVWLDQVTDEQALADAHVALAKARVYERQGNLAAAANLRRALGALDDAESPAEHAPSPPRAHPLSETFARLARIYRPPRGEAPPTPVDGIPN